MGGSELNRRGGLHTLSVILATSCSSMALGQGAQTPRQVAVPQPRAPVDGNGVNLTTGQLDIDEPSLTIGSGESSLAFTRKFIEDGWRHNFVASLRVRSDGYTVVAIGDDVHTFALNSGGRASAISREDPAFTLVRQGTIFYMQDGRGTFWHFDAPPNTTSTSEASYYGPVTAVMDYVRLPTGETINLAYKTAAYTAESGINPNTGQTIYATYYAVRLTSVQSNVGLQLHFDYTSNDTSLIASWSSLSKVTAINNAVDYCDPGFDACTYSTSWPSLSYTAGGLIETVTDASNRQTTYSYLRDSRRFLASIKPPLAAATTFEYPTEFGGRVSKVTNGTSSTNYGWSVNGSIVTATLTDGLNHQKVVTSDADVGVVKSERDARGRTANYEYDANGKLSAVVSPSGVRTEYTREYGRITRTRTIAKAGSGLADLNTYATYPSNCTFGIICDKPVTTTDAMGNVTNYSYDAGHGGLTALTQPAPSPGGARPEVRYAYQGLRPYYKQSAGGGVTAGPNLITRRTSSSSCLTGSSCASGSNEATTTSSYGTSGAANNLFVSAVTRAAGDGSVSATTSFSYDPIGNQVRADGPVDGSSDAVSMTYDAVRQLTQVIDGDNGSAVRRSTKLRYNADGQVVESMQGTSAIDGSNFNALQTVVTDYDSVGRKVVERLKMGDAGGTTFTSTQWSYDAADRIVCEVRRMNRTRLDGSPSACALDVEGSDGPDRLTTYTYTAADELETVKSAQGTDAEQTTQTLAYDDVSGTLSSVLDAKNNRTSYGYDGFDRPLRTTYADNSYEELGYGTNARDRLYVTSVRLRDAQSLTMSYDDLGRRTTLDRPGSDPDVTTAYDNVGQVVTASSGNIVTGQRWDALGRMTAEDSSFGGIDYQYDLAGRRTSIQWRDSGFYVRYTYRPNGDLWTVGENGATSGVGLLANYGYDGLGRRTSLARGNGTTTSWAYADPSTGANTPWLTRLSHDLAGTTADVERTFGYDPSGGIRTVVGSNDAYAHTAREAADITYTADSLNRYNAAGTATLGYDGRGNLTGSQSSARVSTYGYTADNMLSRSRITDYPTSGGTVVREGTYEYDGMGRLARLGATGTVLRYAGDQLISEQDAQGATLQRYVPGAVGDEPVAWFEGQAGERRWLYQDERNSVLAVANNAGFATRLLTYDEYGMPGPNNGNVRHQYTGQLWLGEFGGYHYKARAYSPTLGRFLQSDPIGMAGGINLYAYASNDPINRADPSGLDPTFNFPNAAPAPGIEVVTVVGIRPPSNAPQHAPQPYFSLAYSGLVNSPANSSSWDGGAPIRLGGNPDGDEIVVTARMSRISRVLGLAGRVLLGPLDWLVEGLRADPAQAPAPLDLGRPNSFRGVPSAAALRYARSLGWRESPSARDGGTRFNSPYGGGADSIRVMPGTAAGSGIHAGPYIYISYKGGVPVRIPLAGNPEL